jgi:hypothetical protein
MLEARQEHFGITAALQEFTKELEREMGKMSIARIMADKARKRERGEGNDLRDRKRTVQEIEDDMP